MGSSEELERKIQEGAKELTAEYARRRGNPCAVCGGPGHPAVQHDQRDKRKV